MNFVFDSSALIALLSGENEGAHVAALLSSANDEGEGGAFYVHSVNLAEVYWHYLAVGSVTDAETAVSSVLGDGIEERSDLDGEFWREVAALIVTVRQMPKAAGSRGNLAMGDAFGVALANRLGAEFVTKDRTEIEPLVGAGLVDAHFIR